MDTAEALEVPHATLRNWEIAAGESAVHVATDARATAEWMIDDTHRLLVEQVPDVAAV